MLFYSCLRYDDSVNSKLKYQVQFDFERISAVLEMIDTNYAGWKKGNFWKRLGMRIQYEITEEQTELCTVKGIGGIYVRKLFDAGITSVKKLKSEVTLAKKVLGSKYESIIKNI
jgi:replicative superfamily II helicase